MTQARRTESDAETRTRPELAGVRAQGPEGAFWADGFDMDLLELYPDLVEKWIGATSEVSLWTVGTTTHGRLDHPCCWNTPSGLAAFFWLSEPAIARRKDGWFTLKGGFTSQEPLVEATWLEAMRDCWLHHFAMVMAGTGHIVWSTIGEWPRFEAIMRAVRGIADPAGNVALAERNDVLRDIVRANWRFAREVEQHRLETGSDHPYFAEGSVPGLGAPSGPYASRPAEDSRRSVTDDNCDASTTTPRRGAERIEDP